MTESLERRAKKRAHYLEQTTMLDDREALMLAYIDLGISNLAVAEKMDTTQVTVIHYIDRASARYGPYFAQCRNHFDVEADLEPVEPDDVENWPPGTQEAWFMMCKFCPDWAPDWYDGGGETR